MTRLADDDLRRGRPRPRAREQRRWLVVRLGVPARLVSAPTLAAARHAVQEYRNDEMFLHPGASASRLLFVYGARGRNLPMKSSELEANAAPEALLKFDQPLQRNERLAILFAVHGGKHSRVIVQRGHRRPQALP